jgi:PQQ-like domain
MARTRRRGWKIRTIGTTLFATLALGAAPAAHAATPGDATHLHIDAGNSSSQPVGGPAGTLGQAWSFTTDKTVGGALVVSGRVFAFDGESVFALDAATGRRLWQRRLGRMSTLVYAGGHVITDSGAAGAALALDPATGATAWLSSMPRAGETLRDADDRHVVLGTDNGQPGGGGGLDVLDTTTGTPLWSADTTLSGALAIAGDEVFVGPPGVSHSVDFDYDEEIDAYNLTTGARRVVTRGRTSGSGALSVHDGLLYANSQVSLGWPHTAGAVLNPVTGAQVGATYVADDYPATDAHGIYLRHAVRDPDTWDVTTTLSGFDAPGAAARWTYTAPGSLTQPPLTAGGRVWAAGDDGQGHSTVVGLDTQTGAVAQTLDLGSGDGNPSGLGTDADGPLAAGGGLLLVPSGDRLVAFTGNAPVPGSPTGAVAPLGAPDVGTDAGATGERQDAGHTGTAPGAPAPPLAPRWSVAAGTVEGSPLIVGDTAIVARRAQDAASTAAGQVMLTAYALSDGAVRWDVPLTDAYALLDGWHLAADGGRVYAYDGSTALAAFGVADGHRLWSKAWDQGLNGWPPPVARDGSVYILHGSTATAYDGATGDVVWTRSLVLGSHVSEYTPPPAADADHLYALASSPVDGKDCALSALDRRTGAVDWSVPRRCVEWDGIAASGGRVLFDGAVFDAATGRVVDTARGTREGALAPSGVMLDERHDDLHDPRALLSARRPGGADVWEARGADAPPLLTGPLVWTTVGDRLTALRIGDGSVAWQSALPAADGIALAAASGVLLVTPSDGGLVAWAHDDATGPAVAVQQPPSPTRSATSVVTFSVPAGGGGAGTECAVDGGAFAACTSPWTTPALAAGEHRLRVRSGGGGPGPVSTVVVAVDRTAPVTTLAPAVPAYVAHMTLRFTAGEAARFTCSWDGAAERSCVSGGYDLGNEVSGDGPHTVTIRATDMAGNVASPGTTVRWSEDDTPPQVTASLGVRKTNADTVRPAVTVSETQTRLECALDDAGWAPCPDPVAATARTDGFHTLTVRAVDRAGTTGPEQSVTWQRDTTGPAPDIDARLWAEPQDFGTLSVFLKEGNGLGDLARAECRIDDEAWASCGDGNTWERDGLTQGHHRFQYRAWDDIGNAGPTIVRGFDAWPGPLKAAPPIDPWGQGKLIRGSSWGGTYPDDCTIDGVTRPCPPGDYLYVGTMAPGWHWAVETTRSTSGEAVCSRTGWWSVALPDGSVPGTAPRTAAGGGWSTGPGDPGPGDEPNGSGAPSCGTYASAPGAEPWPMSRPEDPPPPTDPPADPPSDPGAGGTTTTAPPSTRTEPSTTAPAPVGDDGDGDGDGDAGGTLPASDPVPTDDAGVPASTEIAPPAVSLAAPPVAPLTLIGASSPPAAAEASPTTTTATFGPATLRRHGAAALALTVRAPARGVLTVRITRSGTTLGSGRVSVRRAGSVRATVRLTASGRRVLARHRGALAVRVGLRLGRAVASRAVRVG